MAKKMLIDATHPEETRVVVVQGTQVEEFDYESANKRQLRGNIYLAKVTRVEPSLQAAFVEYGGNRHGFLAFSEIHPDYYQIPIADREALAAAEAKEERREAVIEDDEIEATASKSGKGGKGSSDEDDAKDSAGDTVADAAVWASAAERAGLELTVDDPGLWGGALERSLELGEMEDAVVAIGKDKSDEGGRNDEVQRRRRRPRRYKIQEVIKRRQILLVQVVKEERGNKGAALTSYLSLAGRYSVLMPNTGRGGGISRKITNVSDRKRLKSSVSDLDVPEGMGLIIRTAGADRSKSEIKRDYEYLLRLWESVRDLTLKSSAPALVYEEGSLIKRSIRDLYNKEIDSILVEGDEGYKEAKAFMRMLIPSHAKNVQPYRDPLPLFQRHQVEVQLDSMFNPTVQLKSGGYLVINPTEALVAIDVNSGRATREHSIEDTALMTNLEAAEEVARQFRLRDLAGLIVIDFIDMEEHRNNRSVERKLKDSLKSERARIQVGRISSFGLLEMSRQRMRSGLHEGSSVTCQHCDGTGIVKSIETASLSCLRAIEEEGIRARTATCTLRAPNEVALYLLNQKRSELTRIEQNYMLNVAVEVGPDLLSNDFVLERGDALSAESSEAVGHTIRLETGYVEDEGEVAADEAAAAAAKDQDTVDTAQEEGGADQPRRKRRRRRRNGRGEGASTRENEAGDRQGQAEPEAAATEASSDEAKGSDEEDGERPKRKRRRGRRGGRRNRRTEQTDEASGEEASGDENETPATDIAAQDGEAETAASANVEVTAAEPIVIEIKEPEEDVAQEPEAEVAPAADEAVDEAKLDAALSVAEKAHAETIEVSNDISSQASALEADRPTKRGWWNKKSG